AGRNQATAGGPAIDAQHCPLGDAPLGHGHRRAHAWRVALSKTHSPHMTSRLAILRSRLARLRRVRSLLRSLAAGSALASILLIALLALFGLDLLFALAAGQRVVAMLLAAAAIGWSFWRFSLL